MHTSISRIKPITLFGISFLLGLVIVLWVIGDELPFLHPGKEHVYFFFHEDVTHASMGEHILNPAGASDTVWVEPGAYEMKFEIGSKIHTKTIQVSGETYISLDSSPPYVHGDN